MEEKPSYMYVYNIASKPLHFTETIGNDTCNLAKRTDDTANMQHSRGNVRVSSSGCYKDW